MRGIGRSGTVALCCLAAFVVLTVALIGGPLPALDEHVRHWAVTHQDPGVRRLTIDALWLGDLRVAGVALLLVTAVVTYRVRRPRLLVLTLGLAGLLALAVQVLKVVIGRSIAPTAAHAVLGVGGHSYPGGHVSVAVACWGLAAVLIGAAAPRSRPWVAAVAVAAMVLVFFATVYGPAHWITDDVGAVLLGAATIAAFDALGGARLSRSLPTQARHAPAPKA